MGIGDLIKKGFGAATKSKPLVLLLFGFGLIWNLINIPLAGQIQEGNTGVSFSIVALSIIFILLSIFMQAGTLGYVRDVVKSGQSTLGAFKESGMKYYLRVLALGIIVGLLVVVLFAIGAIIFLVLGNAPNLLKAIVGTLLFIAGMVAVLFLFLAPYAAVADDAPVFDALKSSVDVVKNYFWRIFLTGLALLLVLFAFGFVLGLIIGLLTTVLAGTAGQVVSSFLSSLLNAFFGVVVTGTFMTLYLGVKTAPGEAPATG